MKIQSVTVAVIAIVVIAAALFSLPKPAEKVASVHGQFPDPDPKVEILAEDEAMSGKTIRVKGPDGSEVFKYVCTPEDAAVAVFTFGEKVKGTPLPAIVRSARDSERNDYQASITTKGPINVVCIKRGFAVKPKTVDVKITSSFHSENTSVIHISKFAEPVRVLTPPTGSAAVAVEKIATAKLNRDQGQVDVKIVHPLPPDIDEYATTKDTSYGRYGEGRGRIVSSEWNGLDAIEVMLKRYRRVPHDFEFHYKNAKIVTANGRNYLWLPDKQLMGEMQGLGVTGYTKAPIDRQKQNAAPIPSNESLELLWSAIPSPKTKPIPLDIILDTRPGEVIGISPSVEEMGFDSLQLELATINVKNVSRGGFRSILKAKTKAGRPKVSDIPDLTIRLRISNRVKVSTKTIVLPVHK